MTAVTSRRRRLKLLVASALALALTLPMATGQSGMQATEVQPTLDQLRQAREVLAGFENVDDAIAAGYEQFGECMSGPQGGQGVHFRNPQLIEDPALDFTQPELLMYEEREDGSLRLIGAEYIVFEEAWHAAGNEPSPTLLGREFSLNTTLLDQPFYALHLWGWQNNPLGIFANWNPLISCPD